jgi:hypothetical protein
MVSSVSFRWNKIYPSIERLHLRLEEIGCISNNGEGLLLKKEED